MNSCATDTVAERDRWGAEASARRVFSGAAAPAVPLAAVRSSSAEFNSSSMGSADSELAFGAMETDTSEKACELASNVWER